MRIRQSVVAAAAIAASAGALAAPATAAPTQVLFPYSGGNQTWSVPVGVTEATFVLQGASGGDAATGGSGGLGAELHATVPVTPGETLTIVVGGAGSATAGFGGGGAAGDNGLAPLAGAGGGATTVLSGTNGVLLVAGGGGGGGGTGAGTAPGAGGDGGAGGTAGVAGIAAAPSTPGGGGLASGVGGAAGENAGGVAGAAGGTSVTSVGGTGGEQASASAGGNGGGGGGGFVGGGGGGAGASTDATTAGAGGGGGAGGQSFSTANATGLTTGVATAPGNGVAVLTYEPLATPQAQVQPTISGVAQVGRALTCETGTWSGSPSLRVAWLRNGAAIPNATATTYTLAEPDGAQQIACQVTATNAAGSAVARTTAITIPLTAGPTPVTAPSVTGRAAIGERVTCEPGTWTGGTPTFAYVWLRNGRAIARQTASTYTLARADAGQSVQCAVTATAAGLSTTAQSVAVGGPARLVILTTTATVSRAGAVTIQVACFGPTDCAVPSMTATSGQVIARAGARTVRSGASSKYAIRLGKRGLSKLRRVGSSIPVRFVSTPTGGYGGNARLTWVALNGTA
jgi:hypothetical protein